MIAKGVLPDFQEFLLSHKLAPEKHVLFLAIWVSRFLAFSNGKGQQDIGLTVSEFLNAGGCREVQSLPGHKNVEATMVYTHVLRNMSNAPHSPLDTLYK